MSKKTETSPQDVTKKRINIEAIKMNIIVALVFGVSGIIGGYFVAINIQGQARQAVVSDLTVLSKTK